MLSTMLVYACEFPNVSFKEVTEPVWIIANQDQSLELASEMIRRKMKKCCRGRLW